MSKLRSLDLSLEFNNGDPGYFLARNSSSVKLLNTTVKHLSSHHKSRHNTGLLTQVLA